MKKYYVKNIYGQYVIKNPQSTDLTTQKDLATVFNDRQLATAEANKLTRFYNVQFNTEMV